MPALPRKRLHGLIRPPRRRAYPSGSGFASVQNAYKPSAFFSERLSAFDREEVEATIPVVEAGGDEDVEVRVEDEVVAEGLDGGDGGELAVREVEAGAEPITQGFDGGAEEQVEEVASFAKDAAQGPGHGEDELAVGNVVAKGVADPVAGGADAALMAGGAEVAALAGEGEELFVAAIGALKAGEASGEVAAAVEAIDDGDRVGAEGTVGLAMAVLVVGEEFAPGVVDNLPEGRGAGSSGLVDGGHKECSEEQSMCGARLGGMDRMGWISGWVEGQEHAWDPLAISGTTAWKRVGEVGAHVVGHGRNTVGVGGYGMTISPGRLRQPGAE
jgi:hypothetical protein